MSKSSTARYVQQIADDPTMVVVANRTDAVFYIDGSDRKFHFVDRLINKKGHLTETELDSDKPGKGISDACGGIFRHSLDRRFTHHEQVAKRFAKKIANQLAIACRQKLFRDLVLVAEPHFLGLLRKELNYETRTAIRHEVRHEYAQGSDAEVREQILNAIETGC